MAGYHGIFVSSPCPRIGHSFELLRDGCKQLGQTFEVRNSSSKRISKPRCRKASRIPLPLIGSWYSFMRADQSPISNTASCPNLFLNFRASLSSVLFLLIVAARRALRWYGIGRSASVKVFVVIQHYGRQFEKIACN
jgi:hypothetical protein